MSLVCTLLCCQRGAAEHGPVIGVAVGCVQGFGVEVYTLYGKDRAGCIACLSCIYFNTEKRCAAWSNCAVQLGQPAQSWQVACSPDSHEAMLWGGAGGADADVEELDEDSGVSAEQLDHFAEAVERSAEDAERLMESVVKASTRLFACHLILVLQRSYKATGSHEQHWSPC